MSQQDELARSSQYAQQNSECAQCGKTVDPVRAARIRIIWGQFRHFCSVSCADNFEPEESSSRAAFADKSEDFANDTRTPDERRSSTLPVLEASVPSTSELASIQEASAGTLSQQDNEASVNQAPAEELTPSRTPLHANEVPLTGEAAAHPTEQPLTGSVERPARYLRISIIAAVLGIALILAQPNVVLQVARLLLALAACVSLNLWYLSSSKASSSLPWLTRWSLVFPGLAILGAVVAVSLGSETSESFVGLAGVLAAGVTSAHGLLLRVAAPALKARAETLTCLDEDADSRGWHTGQDIVIHAGERIAADVSVTAGNGELNAWAGSDSMQPVRSGHFIYAGARLVSGQLRATVRWVGTDRHWLRLLADPARRADVHHPLVQLVRRTQQRLAMVGSVISIALSFAAGHDVLTSLLLLLAVTGTVMTPLLVAIPGLSSLQTVLQTLRLGIVFKSAQALDRASRITAGVFCARGTVLLGEPELSTIQAVGSLSQEEVLALAAGAELSAEHPLSAAVRRAARTRGVRPDAVRNPQLDSGLGITAVTSDGKPLVVGSRGLMLREKISIARAETNITELEAAGRTALLVAHDQTLVGILGLQDGLRPGARAAVQHLIDVNVEPILMSGDSRQTCETLGRTIDIEHVRPEVLPQDRGAQVDRLRNAGASIAVIGRSPTDDIALSAGDVSLCLPAAGAKATDFDVELASDEVQKGALALRLAHQQRRKILRELTIVGAAVSVGLVMVLGFNATPALAPLIGYIALGALLANASFTKRASR